MDKIKNTTPSVCTRSKNYHVYSDQFINLKANKKTATTTKKNNKMTTKQSQTNKQNKKYRITSIN
jgi:hypothetical protein